MLKVANSLIFVKNLTTWFVFPNLKEVDGGALIEFFGRMLQNTKYYSLKEKNVI